ncbi:MAG: zinc ribbon domain-containing protein [Gemmatimonadota bacterium]|nr:zinc ribbon domain-containing protein [Gemmatimonadota bacterium]MDQ8150618.1 zinc ribbon domain-containing protein [Gemmatimonadota bacterium]MDQ8152279.1 zinc ribbon domain-containing protein [Gemmatimonadota bacterium]MDQ8169533.1 zinc ribbon domain-containing protein [Gemmatimonadota bacterium]
MPYVRCPHCAAKRLPVASICPQCRRFLSVPAPHRVASVCAACDSMVEWRASICPWCSAPRPGVRRLLALMQVVLARILRRV